MLKSNEFTVNATDTSRDSNGRRCVKVYLPRADFLDGKVYSITNLDDGSIVLSPVRDETEDDAYTDEEF